eukprot:1158079-Pelagomonas_calceolata.AAC.11
MAACSPLHALWLLGPSRCHHATALLLTDAFALCSQASRYSADGEQGSLQPSKGPLVRFSSVRSPRRNSQGVDSERGGDKGEGGRASGSPERARLRKMVEDLRVDRQRLEDRLCSDDFKVNANAMHAVLCEDVGGAAFWLALVGGRACSVLAELRNCDELHNGREINLSVAISVKRCLSAEFQDDVLKMRLDFVSAQMRHALLWKLDLVIGGMSLRRLTMF